MPPFRAVHIQAANIVAAKGKRSTTMSLCVVDKFIIYTIISNLSSYFRIEPRAAAIA
jgi:hypothetical protein